MDELSLNLAPLVVQRLLSAIRSAANEGLGVLLVEQRVSEALAYADRAYVLSKGRIEIAGTVAEVRAASARLESSYLGTSAVTNGNGP